MDKNSKCIIKDKVGILEFDEQIQQKRKQNFISSFFQENDYIDCQTYDQLNIIGNHLFLSSQNKTQIFQYPSLKFDQEIAFKREYHLQIFSISGNKICYACCTDIEKQIWLISLFEKVQSKFQRVFQLSYKIILSSFQFIHENKIALLLISGDKNIVEVHSHQKDLLQKQYEYNIECQNHIQPQQIFAIRWKKNQYLIIQSIDKQHNEIHEFKLLKVDDQKLEELTSFQIKVKDSYGNFGIIGFVDGLTKIFVLFQKRVFFINFDSLNAYSISEIDSNDINDLEQFLFVTNGYLGYKNIHNQIKVQKLELEYQQINVMEIQLQSNISLLTVINQNQWIYLQMQENPMQEGYIKIQCNVENLQFLKINKMINKYCEQGDYSQAEEIADQYNFPKNLIYSLKWQNTQDYDALLKINDILFLEQQINQIKNIKILREIHEKCMVQDNSDKIIHKTQIQKIDHYIKSQVGDIDINQFKIYFDQPIDKLFIKSVKDSQISTLEAIIEDYLPYLIQNYSEIMNQVDLEQDLEVIIKYDFVNYYNEFTYFISNILESLLKNVNEYAQINQQGYVEYSYMWNKDYQKKNFAQNLKEDNYLCNWNNSLAQTDFFQLCDQINQIHTYTDIIKRIQNTYDQPDLALKIIDIGTEKGFDLKKLHLTYSMYSIIVYEQQDLELEFDVFSKLSGKEKFKRLINQCLQLKNPSQQLNKLLTQMKSLYHKDKSLQKFDSHLLMMISGITLDQFKLITKYSHFCYEQNLISAIHQLVSKFEFNQFEDLYQISLDVKNDKQFIKLARVSEIFWTFNINGDMRSLLQIKQIDFLKLCNQIVENYILKKCNQNSKILIQMNITYNFQGLKSLIKIIQEDLQRDQIDDQEINSIYIQKFLEFVNFKLLKEFYFDKKNENFDQYDDLIMENVQKTINQSPKISFIEDFVFKCFEIVQNKSKIKKEKNLFKACKLIEKYLPQVKPIELRTHDRIQILNKVLNQNNESKDLISQSLFQKIYKYLSKYDGKVDMINPEYLNFISSYAVKLIQNKMYKEANDIISVLRANKDPRLTEISYLYAIDCPNINDEQKEEYLMNALQKCESMEFLTKILQNIDTKQSLVIHQNEFLNKNIFIQSYEIFNKNVDKKQIMKSIQQLEKQHNKNENIRQFLRMVCCNYEDAFYQLSFCYDNSLDQFFQQILLVDIFDKVKLCQGYLKVIVQKQLNKLNYEDFKSDKIIQFDKYDFLDNHSFEQFKELLDVSESFIHVSKFIDQNEIKSYMSDKQFRNKKITSILMKNQNSSQLFQVNFTSNQKSLQKFLQSNNINYLDMVIFQIQDQINQSKNTNGLQQSAENLYNVLKNENVRIQLQIIKQLKIIFLYIVENNVEYISICNRIIKKFILNNLQVTNDKKLQIIQKIYDTTDDNTYSLQNFLIFIEQMDIYFTQEFQILDQRQYQIMESFINISIKNNYKPQKLKNFIIDLDNLLINKKQQKQPSKENIKQFVTDLVRSLEDVNIFAFSESIGLLLGQSVRQKIYYKFVIKIIQNQIYQSNIDSNDLFILQLLIECISQKQFQKLVSFLEDFVPVTFENINVILKILNCFNQSNSQIKKLIQITNLKYQFSRLNNDAILDILEKPLINIQSFYDLLEITDNHETYQEIIQDLIRSEFCQEIFEKLTYEIILNAIIEISNDKYLMVSFFNIIHKKSLKPLDEQLAVSKKTKYHQEIISQFIIKYKISKDLIDIQFIKIFYNTQKTQENIEALVILIQIIEKLYQPSQNLNRILMILESFQVISQKFGNYITSQLNIKVTI